MEENKPYVYSNIKMEENKTYAYSSQTCMKCNSVFVYYDGWHCNCETTESLQKIINDTLRALPVGSISRHTPESIPERVQDWVKEAAEECSLREKWEACADRLIVYAKEIQATVINQALYEAVCEDIREYNDLKKEFTDGN